MWKSPKPKRWGDQVKRRVRGAYAKGGINDKPWREHAEVR